VRIWARLTRENIATQFALLLLLGRILRPLARRNRILRTRAAAHISRKDQDAISIHGASLVKTLRRHIRIGWWGRRRVISTPRNPQNQAQGHRANQHYFSFPVKDSVRIEPFLDKIKTHKALLARMQT
jgi:hypothetical protein